MINALVFKEKEMILSCGTFSKNKPRIKKQVSLAYPKSSYANGDILDRNALADVIVAALKKEKMKGVELLMGIQHPQINIVEISVPYVKGKIMQAVNVKLSERFIGITDENYIAYKISKIEGNMCYGMASIVPHKLLQEYYALSMKVGLPLKAIDYIGNIFYKTMHLENTELANEAFIIAETDANEVYAHLYHEGVLKSTRNENGNQILVQDEPLTDDFVFQNRLSFTEEDIEEISELYKKVKQGVEDMYAVRSTLEIFFYRYNDSVTQDGEANHVSRSDEKDEQKISNETETALKQIDGSLIDIRNLCNVSLDFDEKQQKNTQRNFQKLKVSLQKLHAEFKGVEQVQTSFLKGMQEILASVLMNVQQITEIFDRYVLNTVDQKKMDRRNLMQNICKVANHIIVMADMSQNYPEIATVYIEGMILDKNEKTLIEQNLGKYYPIKVKNYENAISDVSYPYLGIYYNDFNYFKDLDLAVNMEKNDKINRSKYDNIILGIGGVMIFGVICIFGLWGYNQYDTYRLNADIVKNNQYINQNKGINDIVSKEKKLRDNVDEVEQFQDYFAAANIDMETIYDQLENIAGSKIEITQISIDPNFVVTINIKAKTLDSISAFMEDLTENKYQAASYDSVVLNDGKYEVSAHFQYSPQ